MASKLTFTLRDQDALAPVEEIQQAVEQAFNAPGPSPRITIGNGPLGAGTVLFVEKEVEISEAGGSFSPGSTLPNGALVLAATQLFEGDPWVVVLAFKDGEYVTWKVDPSTGQANWGGYHGENFAAAAADYVERSGSNG